MCEENMVHFPFKLNQAYYVRKSLIKLSVAVVKSLASAQAFLHVFPAGSTYFLFQRKVIRIIRLCTDSEKSLDAFGAFDL